MLRTTLLSACSALGLLAGLGSASAANIVSNGSFESGLAGWTLSGSAGGGFPAVAIFYNSASGYPTGAFGEAVPPNNDFTNSPDPVGARAAYFVDDFSTNETLSQTVFLSPGTYQIGFSAYLPANGQANAGEATFVGSIAGVTLANFAASTLPAQTWQTYAGSTTIAAAGNYLVSFTFNTALSPSKDVVIDQVYVIAGNPPVDAPAPAALGLFGLGLLGLAAARRRKAG
ncbi:PEP-CTERM sorting domain-containing protein [Roseococcus sp. DSY-14]|uniref:PEP-CTERM sorting domain-containing protein n=1 Tax=Roseococcus sp. DSY-14 TaxID=3369650 RepID=UPI00387A86D1